MKKYILILLAVVGFHAAKSDAMPLSDLETTVRRAVRDTDSTRQTYSDDFIDDYLNDAQRAVVTDTWCLQKSTTIALVAATTFYTLPTDLIAIAEIHTVRAGNAITILEETSRHKLYQTSAKWEQESGITSEYFVDKGTITTSLRLGLHPAPTTSSTGTLVCFYYSQSTDMDSDDDVPLDGYRHLYPYHIALAYHAIARIKARENKMAEADLYFKMYAAEVAAMKDRLGQMPNYYPTGRAYQPLRPR